MPRRKSLTRRLLQHLLLLSLARAILTVLGRGRAWDEWDDREVEPEPAQARGGRRRFAHALIFSMLFFAGLALSAGAGNTVRSLLDEEQTTTATETDTASSTTDVTADAVDAQSPDDAAAEEREAVPAPAAEDVSAPAAPRTALLSTRAVPVTRPVAPSAAAPRSATPSRGTVAKPTMRLSTKNRTRKQHASKKAPAPKPPALDPEVHAAEGSTVWLNRAAPDPTPPAARLRLRFARDLAAYSRQAHVDWALVLAVLRAQGHNGRAPARPAALRTMAFRLAALGGRANAWGAALAYSGSTGVADRAVALRHYYRAVGLASLVRGLLSQKKDLADRVLHDPRVHIYGGGQSDVAAGRIDVRVLALVLYLADTYREISVSCLFSGHRLYARPGVVSAHIYGRAVDIAALGNTSITGHQQPGGITEQAVRSILMLPGGMLPQQVISLLGLGGPSFPLANHYDHIHVGY